MLEKANLKNCASTLDSNGVVNKALRSISTSCVCEAI